MAEWLAAYDWILWVALAVACLIAEALTTSLVSVWFVAGAVAAAIVSVFTDQPLIQIGTFLVCSALMLLVFRRFFRKPERGTVKEGDELMIGRCGVTHTAVNAFEGTVRIGDVYWRAVSETPIEEGTRVRVTAASGTTLRVETIDEKESVDA